MAALQCYADVDYHEHDWIKLNTLLADLSQPLRLPGTTLRTKASDSGALDPTQFGEYD